LAKGVPRLITRGEKKRSAAKPQEGEEMASVQKACVKPGRRHRGVTRRLLPWAKPKGIYAENYTGPQWVRTFLGKRTWMYEERGGVDRPWKDQLTIASPSVPST